MKTIRCFVRCQYWPRKEEFEVVVPDDATEEQVVAAMLEAAIDSAGMEFWADDTSPNAVVQAQPDSEAGRMSPGTEC